MEEKIWEVEDNEWRGENHPEEPLDLTEYQGKVWGDFTGWPVECSVPEYFLNWEGFYAA